MDGRVSRQNSMRGVVIDGLRLASCCGVSTLEVEDLGLCVGYCPGAGLWLRTGPGPRSASAYLVLIGRGRSVARCRLRDERNCHFYGYGGLDVFHYHLQYFYSHFTDHSGQKLRFQCARPRLDDIAPWEFKGYAETRRSLESRDPSIHSHVRCAALRT